SYLFFCYRESNIKEVYIIKSEIIKIKSQEKDKTYSLILNYLRERQKKIPKFPSAGSIFKNPPNNNAGYLLEKVGMKGKRIGNVMVSYEHANTIINLGGGKAKEVKEILGYEIGSVPPIFHKSSVKVFIDERVLKYEYVIGGGGSTHSLLKIKSKDILNLTKALVCDISE
ncbi:MAG: YbaK/EbsC family protein, partial [Nitrososphaeria archaeon]